MMEKRILANTTTRYEKLPAWLMIILACLMVEGFMLGGSAIGGFVFGLASIPYVIANLDNPNAIFDLLSNIHFQLALFIFIALALFAWVKWCEKRPISSLGFFKTGNC